MIKKLKNKFLKTSLCTLILSILPLTCYASLTDTKLVTGTEKLLKDVQVALLILAPAATIAVVVYCMIRKGMSDEMDYKKWQTRIVVAVCCGIGAIVASSLITAISGYFK